MCGLVSLGKRKSSFLKDDDKIFFMSEGNTVKKVKHVGDGAKFDGIVEVEVT